MLKLTDALRGYAYPVHQRDKFICVYCGLDGKESFSNWLSMSWDHLLPKGDPNRDNLKYIVTSCMFCNVADNQYFRKAKERGIIFEGLTPEELINQRKRWVVKTREAYLEYWNEHVKD